MNNRKEYIMPFKNPDVLKAYQKFYALQHKDRIREQKKMWQEKHKLKMATSPVYRERIRKRQREAFKKWWLQNKDVHRERNLVCKAKRLAKQQDKY